MLPLGHSSFASDQIVVSPIFLRFRVAALLCDIPFSVDDMRPEVVGLPSGTERLHSKGLLESHGVQV